MGRSPCQFRVSVRLLMSFAVLGLGCHHSTAGKPETKSTEVVKDSAEVAPRIEHAPLIRAINPTVGVPGQKIRLTGEHFGRAKKVLFAVGYVSHEAEFFIVSDTELEVTVPEFYRVERSFEASIAVVNSSGVSVTCPATADVIRDSVRFINGNFLHVMDGGDVEDARTITVIEDGGIVTRVYGAAWIFVRSRGMLGKADYAGTVFYEPGARLGPSITIPGKNDWDRTVVAAIPVSVIQVAEGIGPFTYQSVSSPASQQISQEPPKVTHLKPSRVTPGSIVTVTGRGLTGTKNVWIAGGYGEPLPAGFQVFSDESLKFEVPHPHQAEHSKFCAILSTPRGTTIAASQEIIVHPHGPEPTPKNKPHQNFGTVMWVRDGEVANPENGAGMAFIENGGSVLDGHAKAFFVRKGGVLTTSSTAWVFSETGARIPEKFPRNLIHQADVLTLSVIEESLDLYPR